MPCEAFRAGGGVSGILCTRGRRRRRCGWCTRLADFLCDARGCSRPICAACARELGPDLHACPDHRPPEPRVPSVTEVFGPPPPPSRPMLVHVTGDLGRAGPTQPARERALVEALQRALDRCSRSGRALEVRVHGGAEATEAAVSRWAGGWSGPPWHVQRPDVPQRSGAVGRRGVVLVLVAPEADADDEETDAPVEGDAVLAVSDSWVARRALRLGPARVCRLTDAGPVWEAVRGA